MSLASVGDAPCRASHCLIVVLNFHASRLHVAGCKAARFEKESEGLLVAAVLELAACNLSACSLQPCSLQPCSFAAMQPQIAEGSEGGEWGLPLPRTPSDD